jgi:hypothetical protein
VLEWRRFKAVRHLTWSAILLAVFPGLFFFVLSSAHPEALIGLYPAVLVGCIAGALHRFKPARLPAQEVWRPETELITPLPRAVEARWSTPRLTLPLLAWVFPVFWLVMVALGVRPFEWIWLGGMTLPPAVVTVIVLWKHTRSEDRRLVRGGAVVRGCIRYILAAQGTFRLKIEYTFDEKEFVGWTPNLSPKTWFGPLYVEERRFVTLLVDPDMPEQFVVYPFCGHQVSTDRARAS